MVGTTPNAGAVSVEEARPGMPAELAPLPATIIGGRLGATASGIALKLDPARDIFHLVLLDDENEPLLALGPYPDEDVVAEWRTLGATSGLSLRIQLSNGAVITPYPQVGRLQLGPVRIRRRHGLLSGRRPRFLTRRKTGRFGLRTRIHREAEIAEGHGI
jgi:hypothetical protein